MAACNEFSSFSTLPPGNAIYPECGSFELTFLFINSISSLFLIMATEVCITKGLNEIGTFVSDLYKWLIYYLTMK